MPAFRTCLVSVAVFMVYVWILTIAAGFVYMKNYAMAGLVTVWAVQTYVIALAMIKICSPPETDQSHYETPATSVD